MTLLFCSASVPVKFLKNWIQTHYAGVLLRSAAVEFKGVERVDVLLRQPGGAASVRTMGLSSGGHRRWSRWDSTDWWCQIGGGVTRSSPSISSYRWPSSGRSKIASTVHPPGGGWGLKGRWRAAVAMDRKAIAVDRKASRVRGQYDRGRPSTWVAT